MVFGANPIMRQPRRPSSPEVTSISASSNMKANVRIQLISNIDHTSKHAMMYSSQYFYKTPVPTWYGDGVGRRSALWQRWMGRRVVVRQRGLRGVRVGQEVGRDVLWKALVGQDGGLVALIENRIVGDCRGAG